ncbi:MAG: T9SS type A sorting domain-containing protein [Bacteroidales bacterium]
MKNNSTVLSFCLSILAVSIISVSAFSQRSMVSDSITMSAGYANEVYYSMKNGVVQTGPRATWDIAFRTMKRSSSILTNDGAGVVLYTYPKSDTTGWATIDTVGLSTWKPMFNDPTDWENGAFSRNAKGHPDYGWCKYNDVTHNLIGDSLFVIKLRDGSFRKLWIVKKLSGLNIFVFRFANLDGTNEQTVNEDLNSVSLIDFSGYSLQTNARVEFEPLKSSWDILFTKYMSVQSNGTPYLVTGVLSNDSVKTKNFHPVVLSYNDFGAGVWDSTRSSIGWNWKVFDMNTFTYKVIDSSVYFIRPVQGDIYKLIFTGFAGSSTGVVNFNLEKAAGAGIEDSNTSNIRVMLFPNPASTRINLYMTGNAGENLSITLTDLSGRQLRADRPGRLADGLNAYTMDVTGVQPGIYFVTVFTAAAKTVTKVTISR